MRRSLWIGLWLLALGPACLAQDASPPAEGRRVVPEEAPEDALLGLQRLERERRPRIRGYGSFRAIDDEETSRAGLEVSRLLLHDTRLHLSSEWVRFSAQVPALTLGSRRVVDRHYDHTRLWLTHEVANLDRRLVLEGGCDLWAGDGGSSFLSPYARVIWKAFDVEEWRLQFEGSARYNDIWDLTLDAVAFEGRVSDYRVAVNQGFGRNRALEVVELTFAAGFRRYEIGGRRVPGGTRQYGRGERYFEARVQLLLAQDPIRITLDYEFFRSRLDLDSSERGLIPVIENSIRHTVTLRGEAPLTDTLTAFALGFLSGDHARRIDFGRASGGRAGLRWEAGLRLTIQGSYGYNSESFLGTSGEVHEAELSLTYVF